MKKNSQFVILSFLSLIFFIFCVNNIDLLNDNKDYKNLISDDSKFAENDYESLPIVSWYNNSEAPIFIDNASTNDWVWARTQPWCRKGDGSWANPYIIENLTINAEGSGSGIYIKNSHNVYFEIRNCTTYNSGGADAGIRLENSTNGMISKVNSSFNGFYGIMLNDTYCYNITIKNCIIMNNTDSGIYIGQYCNYTTIFNNTISNNKDSGTNPVCAGGIFLASNSNHNTIANNTIKNNVYAGLNMYLSFDNMIANNTFTSNTVHNIRLIEWCSGNIIINNIACYAGTHAGIFLQAGCNNNLIHNNNFSYNNLYGIWMYNGIFKNNITENYVIQNEYGMYLEPNCHNNTIHNNTINKSQIHGIYLSDACNYNNISRNKVFDNTQKGMYLRDNSNYNNISRNIVNNSGQNGIEIYNSDYNLISGNTVYNCGGNGIYLDGGGCNGGNNTISNNNVTNVQMGIWISNFCHFNQIFNNNISNNYDSGIYIDFNCDYNNISNNNLSYSPFGFQISRWSDYTFVYGNRIFNNSLAGIYLREDSWSNEIHDNEIFNNSIGVQIGTTTTSCHFNNIYSNLIIENSIGVKIFRSNCNNNTLYNNSFINNGIHAIDNSPSTKWDNGLIGNYWDNYTGMDANDNGIGDTSYNYIGGTASNQDNYPLWWDAPVIVVNIPTYNYQTGLPPPNFEIVLNKANLATTELKYRLWNATSGYTGNITIFTLTGVIDQGLWNSRGNGTIVIQFFANDSRGYISYTNRTILKNVFVPTVDINDTLLYDGMFVSFTAPEYEVTLSKSLSGGYDLNYSWYRIYNGTWSPKYFFDTNGTIDQILWDYQANGTLWIYFYVNDTSTNSGTNKVMIHKDIINPLIDIKNRETHVIYGKVSPTINLDITESSYDTSWYTLDNFNNTIDRAGGRLNQTGWSNLLNGTVTIRFYTIDKAGNLNYTDLFLYIDIIDPILNEIKAPRTGDTWKALPPIYELSITERNLAVIYFSVDGGANNYSLGLSLKGTLPESVWKTLKNGYVTITFYVFDLGGNWDWDDVLIVKEAPEEDDSEPEEDILFGLQDISIIVIIIAAIGGVFGLGGGVIYKKRKSQIGERIKKSVEGVTDKVKETMGDKVKQVKEQIDDKVKKVVPTEKAFNSLIRKTKSLSEEALNAKEKANFKKALKNWIESLDVITQARAMALILKPEAVVGIDKAIKILNENIRNLNIEKEYQGAIEKIEIANDQINRKNFEGAIRTLKRARITLVKSIDTAKQVKAELLLEDLQKAQSDIDEAIQNYNSGKLDLLAPIALLPIGTEASKQEYKSVEGVEPLIIPTQPGLKLKAKQAEEPPKELTEAEKRELQKTEEELTIKREEFICVVHKGAIRGDDIYLCPYCHTFYCTKCAKTLKEKGESCWSCGKEITVSSMIRLESKVQQKIQELEEKLERLKKTVKTLDDNFYTGDIDEAEYNSMKAPAMKKITAIISKIKNLKEKSVSKQKSKYIDATRGGDWKNEGNQSVFYYKVKVENISEYLITNIQVILTSIPTGLEVKSDRYKIDNLKPKTYESPTFKLIAKESCVGNVIGGIVTYLDHKGEINTLQIRPFEIKYVCNLLVPMNITKEEFKEKTEHMDVKILSVESNIPLEDLEEKIKPIVSDCNFALISREESESDEIRIIEGFAHGLYDKEEVAFSIELSKESEEATKVNIKAMSTKIDKLTDLIRDFNFKLDDIKSDTQIIKDYTSQIEDIFEKTEDLEELLRDSLGNDFVKIKHAWRDFKEGKIGKKELIAQGLKLIGKKFAKNIIQKFL